MKIRFARVGVLLFCLAVGLVAARLIPAPGGADGDAGLWDLGRELRQGDDVTQPPASPRGTTDPSKTTGTPTLAPPRPESSASNPNGGVILVSVEVAEPGEP